MGKREKVTNVKFHLGVEQRSQKLEVWVRKSMTVTGGRKKDVWEHSWAEEKRLF